MKHVLYGSPEARTLPSGTYLGLFHGRDTAEEHMEDWGYYGPMIGPITGYHVTYHDVIRIGFPTLGAARVFFPEADAEWVDLAIVEEMLQYDGRFYGDWTVHQHEQTVFSVGTTGSGVAQAVAKIRADSGYAAEFAFANVTADMWGSALVALQGRFDAYKAHQALQAAEDFLRGFEDNPLQEGMHRLIQRVQEAQMDGGGKGGGHQPSDKPQGR